MRAWIVRFNLKAIRGDFEDEEDYSISLFYQNRRPRGRGSRDGAGRSGV